MNLEQIDTSTTAGKIRVMELAEQGRKVVYRVRAAESHAWHDHARWGKPDWDWPHIDYAIISEPVGPDEVWVVLNGCGQVCAITKYEPIHLNTTSKVRYIRADLAG